MKNKILIWFSLIFLIITTVNSNETNQTNSTLDNIAINISNISFGNISEEKIDVIVVFKDEIDENLLKQNNVEIKENLESIYISTVKATQEAIDEIINDPNVEAVELDLDLELLETGSSNNLNEEQIITWNIEKINAHNVWNKVTGNNIKIAVLDTGIDINHPDLENNILGGISFVNNTDYWDDDLGHGTSVTGVISAENNNIGIVGVAPDAEIYSVKVMGASEGKLSYVIRGIQWAIDNKMDIVTMSLGIPVDSPSLRRMVDEAYLNGIILVAGSGKNNEIYYPAKYSSVIAVGSIDENNELTSENGAGEELEFVAPGKNILSTSIEGYGNFDGTSMAAPHVAGTIALLKENNPSLSVNELRAKLQRDSIDLGENGKDNNYGYGLVNVNLEEENITAIIQIIFPEEKNETKKEELQINPIKVEIIKIENNVESVIQTLFYDGNQGIQNITVESGDYKVNQYFDDQTYSNEYNISDGENIIVPLHKITYTHQYVARESFYVWPNNLNHEIYILGFKQNYFDALDTSGYNSDEGILIGSGEEDKDRGEGLCPPLGEPYCWHFWESDNPQSGTYNDGILTYSSAYKRAQDLWNNYVIKYYNGDGVPVDKDKAYYWLGRVTHLMTDMTVPAHTHLDSHEGLTGGDEAFEDFMILSGYLASPRNYLYFKGSDYTNQQYNYENLPDMGGFNWNNVYPTNSGDDLNLFKLFWYTAQKTQYYASDDVDGNIFYRKKSDSVTKYYFSFFLWSGDGVTIVDDKGYIEDNTGFPWYNDLDEGPNLANIAEANIPHAMKAVAGLYRLFWIETSDQECPGGSCCDSYDHFKLDNEQPTGINDEHYMIGTNGATQISYIKKRNYYCDGESSTHSTKYEDIATCGTCKYAVSGASSCSNYGTSTLYNPTQKCCAGPGDNNYNSGCTQKEDPNSPGDYLCQAYCDNNGNADYADSCVQTLECDPDDDNDGVLDINDLCNTTYGLTKYDGCPDTFAPNITFLYFINNFTLSTNWTWLNITTDETATCNSYLTYCENNLTCEINPTSLINITNETTHSQYFTNLNDSDLGWYEYSVNCTDNLNNSNISSFIFYVDFCTPNWIEINTTCQSNNIIANWYNDTNSCYSITELESDNQPPENLTGSCDYCNSSWYKVNTSCQSNDNLIGYFLESGSCCSVTGLESDCNTRPTNNTYSCDFCKPNWNEVNTSCLPTDNIIGYYNDSNNCFAQTGLDSDNIPPENNTYSCDYSLLFYPVLDLIENITVNEGELITIIPTATDPNNDTLTFTFTVPLDENGEWQTNFNDAGEYFINVTANDGVYSDSQIVKITVLNVNQAPNITSFSPVNDYIEITEEQSQPFVILYDDFDNDTLTVKWYKNNNLVFEETALYSTSDTLEEGATKVYTLEKKEYEITTSVIRIIGELSEVMFFVNGELTTTLSEGQSHIFNDNSIITVVDTYEIESGEVAGGGHVVFNFAIPKTISDYTFIGNSSDDLSDVGIYDISVNVNDGKLTDSHSWTLDVSRITKADNSSIPVLIDDNSPKQIINITVPDVKINLSKSTTKINEVGDKIITLANELTLQSTDMKVEIPADINITGKNATWDGTINAPTVKTTAVVAPTPTAGNDANVEKIIEIGFGDEKLILSKAVRLLIPGQAGNLVGYSRVGEPFHKIEITCDDDTQSTNNLLPDEGDCKIDVGSDLVIWTKHFTQFITYTETATPQQITTSGGGGGGNSGGSRSFGPKFISPTYPSLSPNALSKIGINRPEIPFKEVSFRANKQLFNYKIIVEKINETVMPSKLEKAYQYVKIDLDNFKDEDIIEANIEFVVKKSWLNETKTNRDNIKLYRYDGTWNELSTEFVKETEGNVYFKSTSPGFSYFAISSSKEIIPEEKEEEEKPKEEETIPLPEEEITEPTGFVAITGRVIGNIKDFVGGKSQTLKGIGLLLLTIVLGLALYGFVFKDRFVKETMGNLIQRATKFHKKGEEVYEKHHNYKKSEKLYKLANGYRMKLWNKIKKK